MNWRERSWSYHTPPRVEEQLLVFGSPVSQSLPSDVGKTCSCPIPLVIRIKDDVKMVVILQENEEPLPLCVWRSHQDITWVLIVLLMGVLRLTSVHLLVGPIVMPNNLVFVLIHIQDTSWVKIFDFHVAESSMPPYHPPALEGVIAVLDLLAGRLELQVMFQPMSTEDLCQDLCQLVLIQWAIVYVLCLVEETASDMLHIFVNREAEWEQMQEDLVVDNMVDAGHGIDNGENFDFDSDFDL